MKIRAVILAVALAAVGATPASSAGNRMFPPAVITAGGGAKFPLKLGEPALWKPRALRNYSQRIRLFIGGHTIGSWSIRIDIKRDGRGHLFFKAHDGKEIVRETRLPVQADDLSDLEKRIRDAQLWEIFPQFFVGQEDSEDDICIDGMTVILERLDANGYRYAEGNAQCTFGSVQSAVAEKLMRMARQPTLISLLH